MLCQNDDPFFCQKAQNCVYFEPYNFVQISSACGPNTYQIMYGETLDFQCQHQQYGIIKYPIRKSIFAVHFALSLLLRPLFIKFSLLTTKQIISPATSTFFLGRRGSRIGAVLVLNGQMSWHVILIFRIIPISKRGYRSRLICSILLLMLTLEV